MYLPSNFHEDASRHYLLKLERARDKGYKPNVKPKRTPSKETMLDILVNGNISTQARKNLQARIGKAKPTDPLQAWNRH